MHKKAVIEISLVKQAADIIDHKRLEKEIKESVRCDWLAEVEKVIVNRDVHTSSNAIQ